MPSTIAIDLGALKSVVAMPQAGVGKHSSVSDFPDVSFACDPQGYLTIKSAVGLDDTGRIVVGDEAHDCLQPIKCAKRHLGRSKRLFLSSDRILQPHEATAELLRYLRGLAEFQLGESVNQALITTPVYFGIRALKMMRIAAKEAGFATVQILRDPHAVAFALCRYAKWAGERVMIYDLGGSFSTSIVQLPRDDDRHGELLAYESDRYISGDVFDGLIGRWLAAQIAQEAWDLTVQDGHLLESRLTTCAERAKNELTFRDSYLTNVTHPGAESIKLCCKLGRREFEAMISSYVEVSIQLCQRAVKKASENKGGDQLDSIVLIGGASRIPLISHRLEEEFGLKPRAFHPDLAVAVGAGLLAREGGCESNAILTKSLGLRTSETCRILRIPDGDNGPDVSHVFKAPAGDTGLPQCVRFTSLPPLSGGLHFDILEDGQPIGSVVFREVYLNLGERVQVNLNDVWLDISASVGTDFDIQAECICPPGVSPTVNLADVVPPYVASQPVLLHRDQLEALAKTMVVTGVVSVPASVPTQEQLRNQSNSLARCCHLIIAGTDIKSAWQWKVATLGKLVDEAARALAGLCLADDLEEVRDDLNELAELARALDEVLLDEF